MDRDVNGAERPAKAEPRDISGSASDPNQQHLRTDHLLANLKGRTISSAFITTVSQGVKFVLTLGSTMILARLLTPQDFGLVAMVTTITGFLRVFKDAGLPTATIQREDITHAQVSNLFWINVGLGGLICLLVAASAPAIAWFYREPRLVAITLPLSLIFLLNSSTVQHQALLSRQMRFKAIALIEIGSLLAGISVGIAMAWLKHGYWSLVGLNLTMEASGLLLTWSLSRWRPQLPGRRSGTRPLLSFGANLTGATVINYLSRSVDRLLIGRCYGADAVGLYSRAMALLMRPMQQMLAPISAVFEPTLARLQGDPERYRRTFLQLFETIALAGFAFTGLFLALSRPLTLVVLGPQWEKAAAIFAGFTLATVYIPLSISSSWLFVTQGRAHDLLIMNSILSIVTISAFVAGLPFGPLGVAIAFSATGLVIRLPLVFFLAGRRGAVSTADLWTVFLRHLPLWVVAFGATYLPLRLLDWAVPPVQLLICTSIGLVVVAGATMARSSERQIVLRAMGMVKDLLGARLHG